MRIGQRDPPSRTDASLLSSAVRFLFTPVPVSAHAPPSRRKEREELNIRLKQAGFDLKRTGLDAGEEKLRILSSMDERSLELEGAVRALGLSLRESEGALEEVREDMDAIRSNNRSELSRMRAQTRKVVKAAKCDASRTKKETRRELWEILTELDRSKLGLIEARKAVRRVEERRSELEGKLEEMERTLSAEIEEAQQCVEAENMLFSRKLLEARERVTEVAKNMRGQLRRTRTETEESVQRAMVREDRRVDDFAQQMEDETFKLRREVAETIQASKAQAEEAVSEAEDRYEFFQDESKERLSQTREKAEWRVKNAQRDAKNKIAVARAEADRQKNALIREKESETAEAKVQADAVLMNVSTELGDMLSNAKVERDILAEEFKRDEETAQLYEVKRESFRALAGLTWKLSWERAGRLKRRIARRSKEEEEEG